MFGWFRTLSKKTQWSELDASSNAVDALEAPTSTLPQAPAQLQPASADAPLMLPGDAVVADDAASDAQAAEEFIAVQPAIAEEQAASSREVTESSVTDELTEVAPAPVAEFAQEQDVPLAPVAIDEALLTHTGAHAAAEAEAEAAAEDAGLLAAPSTRPSMPLSAHPNFAGLGLAEWAPNTPRLLEPTAALGPDAAQELLALFDDLFGPTGRYRLEWRVDRAKSDDAMFAEIMVADLVRRVQNTLGDLAEQRELEAAPAPRAIEAAPTLDAADEYRQAS